MDLQGILYEESSVWLFLLVTGVPAGEAALLAVVVVVQAAAGCYVWSLIRRGHAGAGAGGAGACFV